MKNALFIRTKLRGASFVNAIVTGTQFEECDLTQSKIQGANWKDARFNQCQIDSYFDWKAKDWIVKFFEGIKEPKKFDDMSPQNLQQKEFTNAISNRNHKKKINIEYKKIMKNIKLQN